MADIVGVIVGGVLAVGGGAASQWFLHHLKTQTETRQRRGVKFEEMVAALYEYDHWLDNKRNRLVYGKDLPETASPFAKLYAISAVYFRQFSGQVRVLEAASREYELWMTQRAGHRLAKELNKLNEGFNEAYDDFSKRQITLKSDLLDYAEKVFRAETSTKCFSIK